MERNQIAMRSNSHVGLEAHGTLMDSAAIDF